MGTNEWIEKYQNKINYLISIRVMIAEEISAIKGDLFLLSSKLTKAPKSYVSGVIIPLNNELSFKVKELDKIDEGIACYEYAVRRFRKAQMA